MMGQTNQQRERRWPKSIGQDVGNGPIRIQSVCAFPVQMYACPELRCNGLGNFEGILVRWRSLLAQSTRAGPGGLDGY